SESFAILCDASNSLSVGAIAEMFCFGDTSSFSRAFRREFGASPGDVRAASSCGLRPVTPAVAREQNVNTFADCLRSHLPLPHPIEPPSLRAPLPHHHP